MSWGQRRKSVPIERLRSSSAAAVGAEKRPPQSLCDFSSSSISRLVVPRSRENRSLFCGRDCRYSLCSELLVAKCAHTIGKGVEPDESRGIALPVDIVLSERHEPLVVQCILACPAHDGHIPLVEPERHATSDTLLRHVHESVVRF